MVLSVGLRGCCGLPPSLLQRAIYAVSVPLPSCKKANSIKLIDVNVATVVLNQVH